MLRNPFTPSEIAANPETFFGRTAELQTLERSLSQGSVVIQGPIGIGKSSLMARGILMMEGFNTEHRCRAVIAVGHKDVTTEDEAARLLLEELVHIDEKQNTAKFRIGSLLELGSTEVTRYFTQGRHLAALKRLVEADELHRVISGQSVLLLGIDEADKCPIPIARLLRSLLTHAQHRGVRNLRFLVVGVSPVFQHMVAEDPGIHRFVYQTVNLQPMSVEEATDLMETKLCQVVTDATTQEMRVEIDPRVIQRIVALSGGHPHILQLLGSHLIEHENEDPDGLIDARDLTRSLHRICYSDRAAVYDATLHMLEVEDKLDTLLTLLGMSANAPVGIVNRGFPTVIDREIARGCVEAPDILWLAEHNILSTSSTEAYGLYDEFLRIRLMLNATEAEEAVAEQNIIEYVRDVDDLEGEGHEPLWGNPN